MTPTSTARTVASLLTATRSPQKCHRPGLTLLLRLGVVVAFGVVSDLGGVEHHDRPVLPELTLLHPELVGVPGQVVAAVGARQPLCGAVEFLPVEDLGLLQAARFELRLQVF